MRKCITANKDFRENHYLFEKSKNFSAISEKYLIPKQKCDIMETPTIGGLKSDY